MSERKYTAYGFNTKMVHAGATPEQTGSVATPIYQTTAYEFLGASDAAEQFELKKPGQIYTRLSNPTCNVLEQRLAALENGVGCVTFSSGMAAILACVQALCDSGDELVSLSTLYGGTYTLFHDRLPKSCGITAKLIEPEDFAALEQAIGEKTRLVYIESLGNPNINIPDIQKIAEIAHKHGLPLVCDNTFLTPYLFDAKAFGVDFTVHSLTKYVGGHGSTMGGSVTDLGTFDFKGNPRFASFNTPDPSYHGIVYSDLGETGFLTKLRAGVLRDTGACLAPLSAFLLLQGIETLSLRMDRHSENGFLVGEFLSAHPQVASVNYPALATDPFFKRFQQYCPKGAGGILSFEIKGGVEAGRRFIDALTLFKLAANVSDVRSLVVHPASTTHSQLDKEGLLRAGVLEGSIRLSVGLEDVEDLTADLAQALQKAKGE